MPNPIDLAMQAITLHAWADTGGGAGHDEVAPREARNCRLNI